MATVEKNPVPRITLQEIADEAGVSRATVSLILANRTDYIRQFRPETVTRVRAVAEKLGYRSGLLASSLRSLRSSFFGLVLRGPQGHDLGLWHDQAFEGLFIAGVLLTATEAGIYPVVATQEDSERADATERINAVLDGGVFGAIVRSPEEFLMEILKPRIERGLPVVAVFPDYPTRFESNMIDMDNRAAGLRAGKLLAEAGRRRWFVVQDYQASEAQRLREDGIRQAAEAYNASVFIDCLPRDLDEDGIIQWVGPKLQSAPPDGIFATSSIGAIGALLSCEWAGLDVPEQISLVGCDVSLWRVDPHPRITSIEVSWHEAGRRATELLLGCRDTGVSQFDNVMLSPSVVPGMTCPGGNGHSVIPASE
jgi:LacI family transcriptional regulator